MCVCLCVRVLKLSARSFLDWFVVRAATGDAATAAAAAARYS